MTDPYTNQRLEQIVANDLRTNELGVRVEAIDERVYVRGEVASEERRDTVLAVLAEHVPDAEFIDEMRVSDAADAPARTEIVDPG